jgi:Flp pilus assembly protein TadD
VTRAGDGRAVIVHILPRLRSRSTPELLRVALERAVVVHPDDGMLWNELGGARREAGEIDRAAIAYERAVRARLTDPGASVNLAAIRVQQSRPRSAVTLLEPLLARRPRDAELRRVLGGAYYDLGRRDDAERVWRDAVAIDPNDGLAHYNLGQLAIDRGRYVDALEPLLAATRLRPRDPRGWGNLGIALLHLQRPREARGAFERVVELDPSDERARAALRDLR